MTHIYNPTLIFQFSDLFLLLLLLYIKSITMLSCGRCWSFCAHCHKCYRSARKSTSISFEARLQIYRTIFIHIQADRSCTNGQLSVMLMLIYNCNIEFQNGTSNSNTPIKTAFIAQSDCDYFHIMMAHASYAPTNHGPRPMGMGIVVKLSLLCVIIGMSDGHGYD